MTGNQIRRRMHKKEGIDAVQILTAAGHLLSDDLQSIIVSYPQAPLRHYLDLIRLHFDANSCSACKQVHVVNPYDAHLGSTTT